MKVIYKLVDVKFEGLVEFLVKMPCSIFQTQTNEAETSWWLGTIKISSNTEVHL